MTFVKLKYGRRLLHPKGFAIDMQADEGKQFFEGETTLGTASAGAPPSEVFL